MSFFQKLFGKKKYLAKDNLGTRYDTEGKVTAAWHTQGMMVQEGINVESHFYTTEGSITKNITAKGYPYFCYRFADQEQAEKAFISLPFIEKAEDTGEFISLKVLEFSCILTDQGDWEVIVWGDDLDSASFAEALKIMKANNGKEVGTREPQATAAPPAAAKAKPAKPKVKHISTSQNGPNTYEVYKADSKEAALAYLQDRTVDKKLYYVVVETPEGSWGRDIQGVYKE